MPDCWLVKAAFTPLMAAPEESSTVPVTVPRLVWQWPVAVAEPPSVSTYRKERKERLVTGGCGGVNVDEPLRGVAESHVFPKMS